VTHALVGHLSVTADTIKRLPIASADRDYSRGRWTPGGSFADASNISRGGNTVLIVKSDGTGFRSVALGNCDPADGYTDQLSDPPGPPVPEGDIGCGYDYSSIMWETVKLEQQNLLLNARHPLGESAEIGVVAKFSRFDTDFLYAPSVGTFKFEPDRDLLTAINRALVAQTSVAYHQSAKGRRASSSRANLPGHLLTRISQVTALPDA